MPRHEYDEDADRFLPGHHRRPHRGIVPQPVAWLIYAAAFLIALVVIGGAVVLVAFRLRGG